MTSNLMKAVAPASKLMPLNSSAEASELNDATLKLCQQGDHRAFEEVFNAHKDFVFRMAYRMTSHQQTAEDITQEVFIKVYDSIGTFEFGSRFSTWLYRVAVNECLASKRRKERRKRLGFDGVFDPNAHRIGPAGELATVERAVEDAEIESVLQQALLALPPKLRIVIIMKDIEGLSYEEMCLAFGCSVGTLSSRLNRARKALRTWLKQLGIGKDYFEES